MKKKITTILIVLLFPLLLFGLFCLMADGFGLHTIPIILSQSMIPTALGLCMACVMPAGLMDFSPGARLLFAAMAGGILGNKMGMFGMILGCFLGAMIGSLLIAVLYDRLKVPSMVISLGLVLIIEALTDRLGAATGFGSTVVVPAEIIKLAKYPKNIIFAVVACLLFYYIFYKTKFGCMINAVGNDEALLKNMGINVDKIKFKALVLSGVFCFIAAIMQICYSSTVQAVTNMTTMTMVFKPMMGVIIAIELVKLYDNMPLMILVGEILIQIVFNGFIAMGWSDNIQNIVLGMFLLCVMGVSENTGNFTEYMRKKKVRKLAGVQN